MQQMYMSFLVYQFLAVFIVNVIKIEYRHVFWGNCNFNEKQFSIFYFRLYVFMHTTKDNVLYLQNIGSKILLQ